MLQANAALNKRDNLWTLKPGKWRAVPRVSAPTQAGGLPHMLPEMPVM